MIVEPRKKMVYFGIHIDGQKPKRKFWRNLVFAYDTLAQFYYDQECFALPETDLPEKFRLDYAEDWEIEGRNFTQEPLKEFQLPPEITVMMMDFFEVGTMGIKMTLQADNAPSFFYSSSFTLIGCPEKMDLDIGRSDDMQVFGVRLRPSCFAPNRKSHVSMRDATLPGLWYFTIGYRREKETLPIFMDEIDPCALCPNKR